MRNAMKITKIIAFVFLFALMFVLPTLSQQTTSINTANRPESVPFKAEYLNRLKLPQGFKVAVFADNLRNPRMLQVRNDGAVYVTRPEQKDVLLLVDTNSDGRVDQKKTIVSGLNVVHGITIHDGKL